MGLLSFFSEFGKVKFEQVGQSITQRIVSWDPETATEAEISEMIKELDKITQEAGQALTIYQREQKEADTIHASYDRYLAAAQLLNSQTEQTKASGDMGKAAGLETSLNRLLDDMEKMKPEVDREVREAEEAKEYYEEMHGLAQTAAEKVKQARTQLEQAKRDMKRANVDQQRASERAERSERLAGLRKDTSSMGVALQAMNKQAEEARTQAQASDLKAKLLAPTQQKQDDNIDAALKLVSGQGAPQLEAPNASDRLRRLSLSE